MAAREEASRSIAVLPLGATEQHGPHLPAETDAIIAGAMAEELAKAAPADLPLLLLPAEAVGYSPEHLDYEGTLSLPYDEAIERWISIGADLAAQGVRKLMLLNAHGGNSPLMTIVATELRVRHDMFCVATSWTRFGAADGLFDPDEIALGIHAGALETSVMLALRPELVRRDRLFRHQSQQEGLVCENAWLRAYGRHAFGWKMQDLNPAGAVGDATLGDAEKGRIIIARAARGLVQLAGEMHRFDLSRLKNRP